MARLPFLRCRGHRRYFEPLAVAEAFVRSRRRAHLDGLLGLHRRTSCPSAGGQAFDDRVRRDRPLLHAHSRQRCSTRSARRPLGGRPDASLLPLHTDSAAPTTPGSEAAAAPPLLQRHRRRRRQRRPPAPSADAAAELPPADDGAGCCLLLAPRRRRRRRPGRGCAGGGARGGECGAAGGERGRRAGERGRTYFNAPPFSALKCGRALAIFVGLTLWVGVWDLVDYHRCPPPSPRAPPRPTTAGPRLRARQARPHRTRRARALLHAVALRRSKARRSFRVSVGVWGFHSNGASRARRRRRSCLRGADESAAVGQQRQAHHRVRVVPEGAQDGRR